MAFASFASNLVTGDVNLSYDAFLKDRNTGAVTLVSVPDGLGFANDDSYFPVVSDDGRYVAFESYATNLVTGDTNAKRDIFVRDVVDETTIRVSVDSSGTQGNGHNSSPRITPDGRYVAFHSAASNLVSGDTNAKTDVFVRDLVDGTTVRVSLSSTGTQGNDSSFADGISADGRSVAMSSSASNLVASDTNVREDIFVRDRVTGTTERVSIDSSGGQANSGSYLPAMSADGGIVAFESTATNLIASDTNARTDIFVRRIAVGITERASVSSGGVEANGNSFLASVAGAGGFVTFDSLARNLITGDSNGTYDTFVRELGPPPTGEAELIYVHGITRDYGAPGFSALLDPLFC